MSVSGGEPGQATSSVSSSDTSPSTKIVSAAAGSENGMSTQSRESARAEEDLATSGGGICFGSRGDDTSRRISMVSNSCWPTKLTSGGPLVRQDMRTLSGGEFQRVMIARAISRKPELLVLDEPVQGVDFTGETELYDLITRLRDDLDCGVILVSHDLHVVMAATDKVICLNGHVCCSGTPKLVAESDEYPQNLSS